jgi:hypothetical protein
MEGNERRRKEGSRMISARSMARREDHRFNESERVRMREEKSEGENENTEYLRKEEVMAQPKTAPSSSLQQPRLRQGVHVPTLPKLVFSFWRSGLGTQPERLEDPRRKYKCWEGTEGPLLGLPCRRPSGPSSDPAGPVGACQWRPLC